jgi:nitrogen fixation/metabolism regulation signal transduction histidine kinase
LAGRLLASFVALLILMAAIAAGATALPRLLPVSPWTIFLLLLLAGVPLGAWWVSRMVRPLSRVVRGVGDGIRSFRDRDFSVRLAYRRDDELGELVDLYNQVGEILQEERRSVRQRELLLQTALDRSPAAILLVGPTARIVYSNREARRMLAAGGKLEGQSFEALRSGCPPAMREVLDSQSDGIFTIAFTEEDDSHETYHLSQRGFLLNQRRHHLLMLRRLTGELGRREAQVWKQVIRVISHELNNSLAPVSSLVHSARKMVRDPRWSDRSEEAFDLIRERLDHLQRFIEGYARFARMPNPRPEAVDWTEFLAGFETDYPQLTITGRLPTAPGWFDPSQLRQVVQNLVKNAVEASPPEAPVTLRVERTEAGTYLQVIDHGKGMDEETMSNALLPFYSTKQTGTGLGLPLCREILEAHGGKLSLQTNPEGGIRVTCWLPPTNQRAGDSGRAEG